LFIPRKTRCQPGSRIQPSKKQDRNKNPARIRIGSYDKNCFRCPSRKCNIRRNIAMAGKEPNFTAGPPHGKSSCSRDGGNFKFPRPESGIQAFMYHGSVYCHIHQAVYYALQVKTSATATLIDKVPAVAAGDIFKTVEMRKICIDNQHGHCTGFEQKIHSGLHQLISSFNLLPVMNKHSPLFLDNHARNSQWESIPFELSAVVQCLHSEGKPLHPSFMGNPIPIGKSCFICRLFFARNRPFTAIRPRDRHTVDVGPFQQQLTMATHAIHSAINRPEEVGPNLRETRGEAEGTWPVPPGSPTMTMIRARIGPYSSIPEMAPTRPGWA